MLTVAQRRLSRFGARFQAQSMDARDLPRSGMTFDAALCARVLMHFPLAEQITFLRGVTEITRQRVVFTQGLNTPWHRLRRRLKRLLRNQAPAVYPLRPAELRALLDAAGLREVRRWRLMPLFSESIVVVAERI
jgi:ubiquinone/menaquinone biosynthesis C-methylase UbiE